MIINITNYAFLNGLGLNPFVCSLLLLLCIVFFAFTTIIGWNLYGMKCIAYLTNNNKVASYIYLALYILMVLLGAFLKVELIWGIADVANALMAIPNLFALIFLSKKVAEDTNHYDFKNMQEIEVTEEIQ